MPRDLQMLLMSLFLTLLMQRQGQLCPTRGRMRPSRRFGAARQVFVVAKLSDILTTCPYFDNILNLAFLMHVVGGVRRKFPRGWPSFPSIV